MKMTTTSPRETELLGERLAQQLKGGEVLALFGGMGMGKRRLRVGLHMAWMYRSLSPALPLHW